MVVLNFLNKKNAADQRVYELLAEKFKLFSGVFGASDDVLGTIESGVDFEKRIVGIYQQCRNEGQIAFEFDQLQREMEQQIDERMKITRQKLLENFDEEVHEKLRVNLRNSREVLSKYDGWLWQLTRIYLSRYAEFDDQGHSFTLKSNPFPDASIHPGPYRSGRDVQDANLSQRFQSDTERRFAVVLENDEGVLKWFKPARGDFQIDYRGGSAYEPDFVVETKTGKFICEPKAADDMSDQTVLDKAESAVVWCAHATKHEAEHGGKPWSYLLIPHDVIAENKTFSWFIAACLKLSRAAEQTASPRGI